MQFVWPLSQVITTKNPNKKQQGESTLESQLLLLNLLQDLKVYQSAIATLPDLTLIDLKNFAEQF